MSTETLPDTIEQLEMASRGELEVHAWTGMHDIPMKYLFVSPGTEVSPDAYSPGDDIQELYGVEYSGKLTPEQAQAKRQSMLDARVKAMQEEGF